MTSDDIIQFIDERGGGVTFVEIRDFLEGNDFDTKGTWCLDASIDHNIVFWVGMNEAFCDLMGAVMASPKIDMRAANPLTYLFDGGFMNIPLVKRIPKNGYKDLHWLPVVFWIKGKCPGDG